MNIVTAVCPVSFDPVTVGQLDIITRASGMVEKLIVVVASNSAKKYSFSPEERVEMIRKCTSNLQNVEIVHFEGLLADYAAKVGATAIIKGLRAMSDFEYEFQMALANKKLNPATETIFLTTKAENMYLSSSMVKQIASMGGNVSDFVPPVIHKAVLNRLNRKDGK